MNFLDGRLKLNLDDPVLFRKLYLGRLFKLLNNDTAPSADELEDFVDSFRPGFAPWVPNFAESLKLTEEEDHSSDEESDEESEEEEDEWA